jgi:hypothetical protein
VSPNRAPTPDINKSAGEWLYEVLRRAGAPGSTLDEQLAALYPRTRARGRPYRPDPVRLYLGWRASHLLARLGEEQIASALSRLYRMRVTVVYLSRARAELRRLAATIAEAGWTPLAVPQPLAELPAPVDHAERNARTGILRQNRSAVSAVASRLAWLYDANLRANGVRGNELMEELERRAAEDPKVKKTLADWHRRTGGPEADLLIAAILDYDRKLEQLPI